jgi:hypothetical protein
MTRASEAKQLDHKLALEQADAIAAGTTTVAGAAEALTWPVSDVEAALANGRLVAFRYRGQRLVPLWQLKGGGRSPLPGIRELARSFGGDAMALTAWVQAPNAHLQGKTPGEALGKGDTKQVQSALAALGAAAF